MKTKIFLGLAILLCPLFSSSQYFEIDPSFGNEGFVVAAYQDYPKYSVQQLVELEDGRLTVLCNATYDGDRAYGWVQFLPDGSINEDFGTNGWQWSTLTNFPPQGLQIIAGPNGQLFSSFNWGDQGRIVTIPENGGTENLFFLATDGIPNLPFSGSTIMDMTYTESHLYISGFSTTGEPAAENHGYLARLNWNGTVDQTFGQNGRVIMVNTIGQVYPLRVLIRGDKILCLNLEYEELFGTFFPVLRQYNTDGTIDLDFGNSGYLAIEHPDYNVVDLIHLTTDSSGHIFLSGAGLDAENQKRLIVVKLQPDGQPAPEFGAGGFVSFPQMDRYYKGMQIQEDKLTLGVYSITVAGGIQSFLQALNPDGSPVEAAGVDGIEEIRMPYDQGWEAKDLDISANGALFFSGMEFGAERLVRIIKVNRPLTSQAIEPMKWKEVKFSISPNPSDGIVQISSPTIQRIDQLSVFDRNGKKLYTLPVPGGQIGPQPVTLQLPAGLTTGTYVLGGQTATGSFSKLLFLK
jgi:hypothetical protein